VVPGERLPNFKFPSSGYPSKIECEPTITEDIFGRNNNSEEWELPSIIDSSRKKGIFSSDDLKKVNVETLQINYPNLDLPNEDLLLRE